MAPKGPAAPNLQALVTLPGTRVKSFRTTPFCKCRLARSKHRRNKKSVSVQDSRREEGLMEGRQEHSLQGRKFLKKERKRSGAAWINEVNGMNE